MQTELKRVKYNSEDERFNSFSEGDILFEVLGLEERREGEEATQEEEDEYLVFPKGVIVQLTKGIWPIYSYLQHYRFTYEPHVIGGILVRIVGSTHWCEEDNNYCSINILPHYKWGKEERERWEKEGGWNNKKNNANNSEAERKREREKESSPKTKEECATFLMSKSIKSKKDFLQWAVKGGHPNVGGTTEEFQIVSDCVDKVYKKTGGARKTKKFKNRKRKQTKKHQYKKQKSPQRGPQRGGAPLAEMPQLCFGTAQVPFADALIQAIQIGYRHIDGAERYVSMHAPYYNYKETLREILSKFKTGENGLPKVERKDLWITWKDNNITKEKIEIIIDELDCEYIDLFLVHHSCGSESDFAEFKKAQKENLIRYYGVSNCESIDEICKLKSEHNIFANQIQARPPGGKVSGRRNMSPDFIQQCNNLGVNIMLFASISSLPDDIRYTLGNDVNQYYIQKFLRPSNVIMVASQTGSSLQPNYDSVNTFLRGEELLSPEKMKEIEESLQKITLHHM